jgi:hypothetical protein
MIGTVLQALEQHGHAVAFDVGEHFRCQIDTNCPRAVELRKILTAMSLDYKTLNVEEPLDVRLFEGDIHPITTMVQIGSTPIDISAIVKKEAVDMIRGLITRASSAEERVKRLGQSYNNTYNNRVAELRRQGRLTQLTFSLVDMVKYNCRITTDADCKHYLMCFGIAYAPLYTYSDGNRYAIKPDVAQTLIRDVWVVYKITKDRKVVETKLVTSKGNKFHHYHGNDAGDCWGQNEKLHTWDGTLKQLGEKAFSLSRALATVNMNSLLNRTPDGLPTYDKLQKQTTKLGVEGVIDSPDTVVTPAAPAPRWGQRVG